MEPLVLLLCCLLGGGRGLVLPPPELSPTIRVQDAARAAPTRCVERSVTPVSCADVSNSDAPLAHPDDCQLFYYCEERRSSPTCRQCPAGLHFNPTLRVCDWPQSAGCTAQAATPTSTMAPAGDSPHSTTKPIFNTTTSASTNHGPQQNTTQPSNGSRPTIAPTIPSNTNSNATGSNHTTAPPLATSTDPWSSNVTWPMPGPWNPSNNSSNTNTTLSGSNVTTTAPPPLVTSTDSWNTIITWASTATSTTSIPRDSTTPRTETPTTGSFWQTTLRWRLLH